MVPSTVIRVLDIVRAATEPFTMHKEAAMELFRGMLRFFETPRFVDCGDGRVFEIRTVPRNYQGLFREQLQFKLRENTKHAVNVHLELSANAPIVQLNYESLHGDDSPHWTFGWFRVDRISLNTAFVVAVVRAVDKVPGYRYAFQPEQVPK